MISSIRDTQTAIAAAVEEQEATTAQMSHTVGQVAERSQRISANVGGIAGDLRRTVAEFRF